MSNRISVVQNADGRLAVFHIGTDGTLYQKRQQVPGGAWAPGAHFYVPTKQVAVGKNADGRLEMFFIDTHDALYHKWQEVPNGAWAPQTQLGWARQVAVGQNADGRLEMFYIDLQNTLHYKGQEVPNGAWSSAMLIDVEAKQVAVGQNADGRLEVFFISTYDDSLCHRWQMVPRGTSGSRTKFAGKAKQVAVGKNRDGRLEVFFIDMNDNLCHKWQEVPSGAWAPQTQRLGWARQVAVGRNADGRLEVFFIGTDDILYHRWQQVPGGAYAEHEQIGWQATEVTVGQNADGRLEVFYIGADHLLYHNRQLTANAHWAGEYPCMAIPPSFSVGPFQKIYEPSEPWPVQKGELLYAPNGWHVNDHCFVRGPDKKWHMFGIVAPNPGGERAAINGFGHATAETLTQSRWKTHEAPFIKDDEHVLWAPHVILHQQTYYMFYSSGARNCTEDCYTKPFSISLRTSQDLWMWSDQITLQPDPFADGYQARDAMILWNEATEEWVMYYTSTEKPDGGHHIVAYRTSKDLKRWSDRGIAYTDFHFGSDYGPTESPFVVKRGEYWYLFIGPRPYDRGFPDGDNFKHPGYVGTDVFRSKRWDSWTNADYAGHIDAHALEVVQDGDDWYVSHSGIRQGGLFVATLNW